jgi:hypothetical protein
MEWVTQELEVSGCSQIKALHQADNFDRHDMGLDCCHDRHSVGCYEHGRAVQLYANIST